MNRNEHIYGQYVIGTWNINGFFTSRNEHYTTFKTNVIKYVYCDILVIPEHHCHNDQKLVLENYDVHISI